MYKKNLTPGLYSMSIQQLVGGRLGIFLNNRPKRAENTPGSLHASGYHRSRNIVIQFRSVCQAYFAKKYLA